MAGNEKYEVTLRFALDPSAFAQPTTTPPRYWDWEGLIGGIRLFGLAVRRLDEVERCPCCGRRSKR